MRLDPPLTYRGAQRFAYREATKQLRHDDPAVATAIRDHLWRLRVAGLAMFNRGAQSVGDEDLGNDLKALGRGHHGERAAVLGQRTIGQFFFMHAAESDADDQRRAQASYEFLHATFGEFFVADHLVGELGRLAGPELHPDVNDDLLHALISQQILAKRPSVPAFVTELAAHLPEDRRERIVALIDQLVAGARQRPPSVRFTDYTPMGVDRLREMAVYTANLVLLRAAIDSPFPVPGWEQWDSLVHLWRAGLDNESWIAVLRTVERVGDTLTTEIPERTSWIYAVMAARLRGDTHDEQILQYGSAAARGVYDSGGDNPVELIISALIGLASAHDEAWTDLPRPAPARNRRSRGVVAPSPPADRVEPLHPRGRRQHPPGGADLAPRASRSRPLRLRRDHRGDPSRSVPASSAQRGQRSFDRTPPAGARAGSPHRGPDA
ncbi:hypothetical protein [Actinoplanes sp. NPDC023714]|uniref:hypothetical protein n=1 Tax=Actinoplanes sp. NPDC023714 TaxID=3154322 RepID=UPI003405E027